MRLVAVVACSLCDALQVQDGHGAEAAFQDFPGHGRHPVKDEIGAHSDGGWRHSKHSRLPDVSGEMPDRNFTGTMLESPREENHSIS